MQRPAPILSVVIPNYNHAKYLPRCLDGVLAQSVDSIEVIVVDDGSTDNSRGILESYAQKNPVIRFEKNEKNQGVCFTMNRGLALARGKYVSFVGADDEVMPGLFEKQLQMFAKHPEAAMCGTIVEFKNVDTGQTYHHGTKVSNVPRYFSPEEMVDLARQDRLLIFTSTMMLRREDVVQIGGFLPELKWHTDWYSCILPSFRHGFCFIPEVLGEFAIHNVGYSKKGMRDRKAQDEVLRNLLQALLRDQNKDLIPAIKRSGILAPFGKEMLRVLWSEKRYRTLISPTYLKNAAWWIVRIEAKKMLPSFVADLYFRLAGHKVDPSKSLDSTRNKVAKTGVQ
jgi:glycosyltransferase involved in cell wall biosynthesis